MKLKLGLRRQAGAPVDVVVTADSTATVEDIARAIADNDPLSSQLARAPHAALTLAVAPPTSSEPVVLAPDLLIGDAPIGSGFNAAVVAHAPRGAVGGDGAAAATMHVRSGPDAGREFPLRRGNSVIGRDAGVDVVLADPLVSKRHARVEVDQGVELVDLNSANGLLVDGGLVQRVRVIPGQVITHRRHRGVVLDRGRHGCRARPRARTRRRPHVQPVAARRGALPGHGAPASGRADRGRAAAVPVADDRRAGDARARDVRVHRAPVLAAHRRPRAADDARQLHRPAHAAGQEAAPRDRDVRDPGRGPRGPPRARDGRRARPSRTPRRPPWRRCTSRRCGWARCCGPAAPSTGTSSRCGSASAGRGVATRSRSRPTSAASPATPGRSTGSARATSTIDDVPFVELLPSSGAIGIAGPRHLAADVLRGLGVQLFGLHAPNEIVTAAIVGSRLGEGARVDEVAAAHHEPALPVRRPRARRQPVRRHRAAQRARGGDPRAPVGHPEPPRAARGSPTRRWRSARGSARRTTRRAGSRATSRWCSSPRTTLPSTGRGSRR